MFRVAAAFGAAMVIALVAFAVRGQAQNVDGRFQLTAEDDGFLRLDTQTGALSFCQFEEGRWACARVEAGEAPDLNIISDRMTALEAALMDLAARVEQPDIALQVQLEAISAQLEALLALGAGTPELDMAAIDLPRLRDEIAALAAGQIEMARAIEAAARRADVEAILDELAVVNERMAIFEAALAATVDTPIATLADFEEELIAAIAELGGVLGRRIDELAAGDVEIANQLSVLTVRLDEIEGRLVAIAQADDEEGAAITDVRALFEIIVTRQQEIEAEIDALVAAVNATDGDATNELAEELATFREWRTATDTQLLGLFEAIDRLNESISSRLAKAVAPLNEGQIALEVGLAAVALTIEEITSVGAQVADAIAAVEERQILIKDRLAALAEAIEAGDPVEAAFVREAFALVQREIADLRAELMSVNEDVSTQFTAVSEAIDAVNAKIAALPAPVDLAADLARIELELLALRELLTEPEATSPEGGGAEAAADEAAATFPDDPDTIDDDGAAGFGEQLFLRLDDLVDDLRRGLRGE